MYAVELSVDEAIGGGAPHVVFDQPVSLYVDNFLDLPVGVDVPVGFFDHSRGVWVPEENGRVVRLLDVQAGLALLDIDGDGEPDSPSTLGSLGITSEELEMLAGTRSPGTSVWRVQVSHFSGWACGLGLFLPSCGDGGPCAGDKAPDRPRVDRSDTDCNTTVGGSIIECESGAVPDLLAKNKARSIG